MDSLRHSPGRLLPWALLACLTISSLLTTTAQAASSEPATLLEDVSAATHQYNTLDDQNVGMDTAKIIPNPSGGYLAVYHHLFGTAFQVRLAVSAASGDPLLNWHYVWTLENDASQPTIATLSDGGFVVGYEKKSSGSICGGSGHCLAFRHYGSLDALLGRSNDYTTVTLNRTLSTCHEGTPNIYASTLNPDITHSVINVGFHYYSNCSVDREAVGTLTNFSTWQAQPDSNVNALFTGLGTVNGSVGDRDAFFYKGKPYSIIEGQGAKNDFSTWRPYLFDRTLNSLTQLHLNVGSRSFGNPTYTQLTLPGGSVGFVSTEFIFSEGSAPGEPGALIYYRAYPTQTPPDTMPPANVSVTAPANGSTVRRGTVVALRANATDNVGVSKVAFYVNGTLTCVAPFAPYSCNWTVPGQAGVAYTITAQAFDTSSNTSQASVRVTSR